MRRSSTIISSSFYLCLPKPELESGRLSKGGSGDDECSPTDCPGLVCFGGPAVRECAEIYHHGPWDLEWHAKFCNFCQQRRGSGWIGYRRSRHFHAPVTLDKDGRNHRSGHAGRLSEHW